MIRTRFELKNTRYQSFFADEEYFVIQKTNNIIEQYFVETCKKKQNCKLIFK